VQVRGPEHGVRAEGMPFARPGSGFTRDFEDLVAWLVTKTDKTTVCRFTRVAWRTVGVICERVVGDVLDPDRLSELVDIGVDEISWLAAVMLTCGPVNLDLPYHPHSRQ
jgi:transposase